MSLRGSALLLLALLLFAMTSLEAQIRFPGQSPYPGGNPNPGGNGGSGRGAGRGGRRNDSSRSNRKDTPPTVTTTGMLRLVSGSQFVLEADDHRIITYQTTDRTKVEKDGKTVELKDLTVSDHFTIDSTADTDGYFTATGVTFNLAGTAADRAAAARSWDLPTLKSKPAASASGALGGSVRGDDDRPILRRAPDPDKGDADKDAKSSDSGASKSAANSPAPSSASAGSAAGSTARNGASPQPPGEAADTPPATEIHSNDPSPDADDPGKPQLRRGRPIARPRAVPLDSEGTPSAPNTTASANAAPENSPRVDDSRDAGAPGIIRVQEDPIIAKAKQAAREYAGTLPDFFCRQVTTRYETEHPKQGWQALDVVTADVAYQDGHESYTNIKIGNKSVNTGMDDIPGTRSSGEFASILDDLFAPETSAAFRKSGQDTIRGRSAYTFTYEVKRENSHWRIISAAQLYYPAYRGTVWIDRETSRVLRIEMESRNMPLLFPFEKTETATDYDFVRLSTPQQFLMPVNAEVLSCEQSSSRCLRNRIEFRNYRKFGAESDITFGSN
jgi:hypothetical protein